MLLFAILIALLILCVIGGYCYHQNTQLNAVPEIDPTTPVITIPNRVRYIQLQQTATEPTALPLTIREIEVLDNRGHHVDVSPDQITTNGQDARYQANAVVDGNKRENNGLYLKSTENVLGMASIDLGYSYDVRKIILTPWALPIVETMVQLPNTLKVFDEYYNELYSFDVPVDGLRVMEYELIPEQTLETPADATEMFDNIVHRPKNYWRMLSDKPCGHDGIVTTGDCRSP
jgi:hypothetical protein